MKKYGLESPYRAKHAAKGGIDRERLQELVEAGASISTIAETLQRSPSTVRHWLGRYGLETNATTQRRVGREAREAGRVIVQRTCRHHGLTEFWLEGRGAYRCLLCRQEAVVRRRRKVKAILVAEAGGRCAICGYHRHVGGLHFHHLDPSEKRFALSVGGVARSLARARAEAQKCVLLCSNCHAEVEAGIVAIPA
jgi:transposase